MILRKWLKKYPIAASNLFKHAAILGHSRAKLSYGLDLYYGNNKIAMTKILLKKQKRKN